MFSPSEVWKLKVFPVPEVQGVEDLIGFLGLLCCSHTLSHTTSSLWSFSLSLSFPHLSLFPYPSLILFFCCETPSLGSGKMSRTKRVGVWGSFGTGSWSLCSAASWTYKEMGAGEIEKERAMQGQRGMSRKLRVPGVWNHGGDGVRSSLLDPVFRCTEAELLAFHSHPQPPRPLFVIWIPSPPHRLPPRHKSIKDFFGQSWCTYPTRMWLSSC